MRGYFCFVLKECLGKGVRSKSLKSKRVYHVFDLIFDGLLKKKCSLRRSSARRGR